MIYGAHRVTDLETQTSPVERSKVDKPGAGPQRRLPGPQRPQMQSSNHPAARPLPASSHTPPHAWSRPGRAARRRPRSARHPSPCAPATRPLFHCTESHAPVPRPHLLPARLGPPHHPTITTVRRVALRSRTHDWFISVVSPLDLATRTHRRQTNVLLQSKSQSHYHTHTHKHRSTSKHPLTRT